MGVILGLYGDYIRVIELILSISAAWGCLLKHKPQYKPYYTIVVSIFSSVILI